MARKSRRNFGYVFLLLLLIAVYAWERNPDRQVVSRVVDGDGIVLAGGERIRYIGIDTPELNHPSRGTEFFAQEAYKANRRMVEGKRVELKFDVEERDRYGRLLAYVYIDGLMINEWLVANGYAQAASFPPNVKHAQRFQELEQKARELEIGLWAKRE
ncbi:MAG TPA: thermonuclease family protein [Atribacteraceae bacterium]|nr:thermonuclease family protein [Atribacteraceae bacterium]